MFILCDQSKNVNRCIYGAPDMVIEIMSSSTRKKDFGKKLGKYVDAGVREYWIDFNEIVDIAVGKNS